MASTLLYRVFIAETKTVPKELLSLASKDLFLKTLITKNKKPPYLNIMAIIPEERCSIVKKIVR